MIHLPLPTLEEAMMHRFEMAIEPPSIIDRAPVCAEDIAEPSRFAWEVLRRRGDYRASRFASVLVRTGRAPIELIEAPGADGQWGLYFRRTG